MEFELPDGWYSVWNIQDYFEYIIKKNKTLTDNPPIRIYVKKVENRIAFKIKTGYYLELLIPETMKHLLSTKNKINNDENDKNVSHIEITEVVLVYCKIVSNNYQQDSGVMYTFVSDKLFGQL